MDVLSLGLLCVLLAGCIGVQVTCQDAHKDPGTLVTGRDLGVLMGQVVEERLLECHLVLVGAAGTPGAIFHVLRFMNSERMFPHVTVSVGEEGEPLDLGESSLTSDEVLADLRQGDVRFRCRAIVLDITHENFMKPILRFLERTELYQWPETYVVVMGPKKLTQDVFDHYTFRNTANLLYLAFLLYPLDGADALHSPAIAKSSINLTDVASSDASDSTDAAKPLYLPNTHFADVVNSDMAVKTEASTASIKRRQVTSGGVVYVYGRCMYCAGGLSTTLLKDTWSTTQGFLHRVDLFPDQFKNFQGHKFKVVSMNWFPYIEFRRQNEEGGSVVDPIDSLDIRMLSVISSILNFTYEMRVPWDNQWGTSTESGNWTGIVGTLQHHKADFSMMLSWMETRLPVVDYSRIYASEPLVMITSKPLPLSQSFALVRPFSANLWVAMVVSTVVAGVVLWGLQGAWACASGGRALGLGRSLMLTLAILMEDPPSRLPKNITAQMLLGWWWVYCMLLTITYRSSLIAHLTVPGKSATLESLEDLLEVHRKDHWTWGYEPTYGSGWEFLKMNENPTVRKVFSELMLVDLQEQMDRVLAGRHAFITWKYYIRSIIASRYTDARSYTPIHTAKEELFNYGGYGWGFRKGAPFRPRIDELKQLLLEAGLINFWMDELIEASGRKTRSKRNKKEGGGKKEENEMDSSNEDGAQVVLGLGHLQGTFYLLAMGYGIALIAFLFELLFHRYRPPAPAHPHPSSAHNSRSPPTQY